jgi:hypothetical protein
MGILSKKGGEQGMFQTVKSFLAAEDGGAVEWIITMIAGAIIVAVAFTKLKGSPGELGNSVNAAGANAGLAVNGIRAY